MDGFDIRSPRFARYVLSNAALETLATGFRWIEGPVWMGDANCLLFQDLPNDRTMRWIEGLGVSVYRAPSHFANGQTRDRQGRLIASPLPTHRLIFAKTGTRAQATIR
jgi:gluconolactonase